MRKTILLLLAFVLLATISACGKKSTDENTPLDQVKAAAAKMDATQLRAAALSFKDSVVAKQTQLKQISEQLMAIGPTELQSQKATQLKAELDKAEKSIMALKERFNVYYEQLKAKAGDLTGLELP